MFALRKANPLNRPSNALRSSAKRRASFPTFAGVLAMRSQAFAASERCRPPAGGFKRPWGKGAGGKKVKSPSKRNRTLLEASPPIPQ